MASTTKPILYSYYRSSCAWRVRIALAWKGIDYDYKAVSLIKDGAGEQNTEEYAKLNPMKQVPAMVIGCRTLTQSLSILEFLEEKYPERPLLPQETFERAKVREICELIASGIQPLQNLSVILQLEENKRQEWAKNCITKGFTALEQLLSPVSGRYCVGDEVSLADCCLVPQVYNALRFGVEMSAFPIIARLNSSLEALSEFAAAHPSKQPDCPPNV